MDTVNQLSQRLRLNDVKDFASWCAISEENRDMLWELTQSDSRQVSVNSLWIFTHLQESSKEWLLLKQRELTDRLLSEEDTTKKRLFLQLLREQNFDSEADYIVDLLDFCFSKINSECEPYAIRCFCIYTAYNICRNYPELIAELEQHLELLSLQSLSPGLKSALRQIKFKISDTKYR